jgi:hypothetical protein
LLLRQKKFVEGTVNIRIPRGVIRTLDDISNPIETSLRQIVMTIPDRNVASKTAPAIHCIERNFFDDSRHEDGAQYIVMVGKWNLDQAKTIVADIVPYTRWYLKQYHSDLTKAENREVLKHLFHEDAILRQSHRSWDASKGAAESSLERNNQRIIQPKEHTLDYVILRGIESTSGKSTSAEPVQNRDKTFYAKEASEEESVLTRVQLPPRESASQATYSVVDDKSVLTQSTIASTDTNRVAWAGDVKPAANKKKAAVLQANAQWQANQAQLKAPPGPPTEITVVTSKTMQNLTPDDQVRYLEYCKAFIPSSAGGHKGPTGQPP